MLACFTFCMSSISLKNCELAQINLLCTFICFHICSCCSIFNDRLACPRLRGQLIYYTTFLLVCQVLFRKFFWFFQSFFRISFSSKLFVWFRHPFSRRPYIIPQTVRFVKGFFKSFLRFFKVFSWRISPSTRVNFSILFKVLKDLLKAEMLHSSVVFPVLCFETFLIQPKLTGHFSLPLGIAIYWIYLHFLYFPSGQLIYYTTNPLFCQGVFRHFSRFITNNHFFLRIQAFYT